MFNELVQSPEGLDRSNSRNSDVRDLPSDPLQRALVSTDPAIPLPETFQPSNLGIVIRALRKVWLQAGATSAQFDELFAMRRTDFTHAQNVINSAAVLDIWRGFFQGFDSASLALRLIDRLVLELNLAYGNGVGEFRISEKLIDLMVIATLLTKSGIGTNSLWTGTGPADSFGIALIRIMQLLGSSTQVLPLAGSLGKCWQRANRFMLKAATFSTVRILLGCIYTSEKAVLIVTRTKFKFKRAFTRDSRLTNWITRGLQRLAVLEVHMQEDLKKLATNFLLIRYNA